MIAERRFKQLSTLTGLIIAILCIVGGFRLLNETALVITQIVLLLLEVSCCGIFLFRKYKRAIRLPFLIALLIILVKLLDGAFVGPYWRFFLDAVLLFFGGTFLLSNRFRKLLWSEMALLLFAPVSIVFLPLAPLNIWLAMSIPIAFAGVWLFYRSEKRKRLVAVGYYIIIATYSFGLLPSLFHYQNTTIYPESQKNDDRLLMPILSKAGDTSCFAKVAPDKIIVVDVWYTQCGVCFRKFPEFDRLFTQYAADSDLYVTSLNIPMDTESNANLSSFELLQPYSFHKWQAIATTEKNEWRIAAGYPTVFVFDRKGVLRYEGALNTDPKIIIHSIHRLLTRLKQE